MKIIQELLERPLDRKIEEIIKVNQADEQSVSNEIAEYIATDRIRDEYRKLLRLIADAPRDPDENVGVWISGFFGSGKSSFAKNLGYMLGNPTLLGEYASELFKAQMGDTTISNLLDLVNRSIPTKVIMFDVSVDRAVKKQDQKLTDIMYTVLLRELDYAQSYEIAELEIALEEEGKLDAFVDLCEQKYGDWRKVRTSALNLSRASALLHEMEPETFPTTEAWAQTIRNKEADISVGKFVERAFQLCLRRCPGQALVFIIDEVGQYVARSSDKIEDLRAIVEQFGRYGKNLLKAKQIKAPAWIIVTSQEKLDEVVAALDSRRVELARVQDRFKHRVDMSPADIREVATRRVLSKKKDAIPALQKLFKDSQGQLNAACRLERTSRKSDIHEADFIQFYPYLPHFIEMSIDIMSGIRLQSSAPKHLAGSNRTIIKQTYEMLVSERTNLRNQPIGTLVTLDKVFELVEGLLATEKQKDISDIQQRLTGDTMALRVAKATILLEFVRDLPRTEANIAACLVDKVGQPSPVNEVRSALERLYAAQFIRNTEEGWKLQTAQEKNWDNERRAHLKPKQKDRNDITREILGDIFSDAKLRTHAYQGRTFRVNVSVDGIHVGDDGPIPLLIYTADSPDTFPGKLAEVRDESRQPTHQNDLHWVSSLTPEIDALVAEVYASRQMVVTYSRLKSQNQITNEEAASLETEKSETSRWQSRLREKLIAAVESGQGLFRGVAKDGAALGRNINEIFGGLYNFAMPDMYPKLGMAARGLKGTEAEEILKAANLSGLTQVFYNGDQGLNLVIKDGNKYIANPSAEVAKEVLDYLVSQNEYGNRDTRLGKALETQFGGAPYGWERDILRLILATLFRAGSIEVTYNSRRFDTYQDAQSREPFTSNTAFKQALFTPTRPINIKTLTQAVKSYEDLTGESVDVDKNDIAGKLKALADQHLKGLVPLQAKIEANHLPISAPVQLYRETLETIQRETADGCVNILAGEGISLKAARDQMQEIDTFVNGTGIERVRLARIALDDLWPVIEETCDDATLIAQAEELRSLLTSETVFRSADTLHTDADNIAGAYLSVYEKAHHERTQGYVTAIEAVKGLTEWTSVPVEMQDNVLAQLTRRACDEVTFDVSKVVCQRCDASVNQIESDLVAVESLKGAAIRRVLELTAPKELIEYIRLSDYFPQTVDSETVPQFDDAYAQLREQLMLHLANGIKVVLS